MTQWQPQHDPRQQRPAAPPQWQQGAPQPPYGYGQPQYQPPQQPYGPPPRKKRTGLKVLAGVGGGILLLIVIAAVASPSSSTSSSTSSSAPPTQTQAAAPPAHSAAPAKEAAAQTVTYEVTGSAAQVTYGPAGSNSEGTVPMKVTKPLGTPIYYAITAQLQGGGTVTCKILVGGQVISQATANGGYNIAQCEISQDFSGGWKNTLG
jgi:hypothetical protein